MPRDSLLGKILYKKKFEGEIERDGKIYKKYSKRRRFKFPQGNTLVAIMIIAALGGLYLLVNNLISKGK